MTMRVLDLFSGIGGFSLGLERAGMQTVAFCEIDPFCRRVLAKHWPGVPIYDDVRTLTAKRLVADGIAVDLICGGFPCQDISVAGKGAGIEGERSGLWSEYARIIGEIRPRYVIVENVAALLGRGLDRVLGDLSEIGFDAEWHCIPASAVGAPHRRDRLWLVANPGRERGATGGEAGNMACSPRAGEADGKQRQWDGNAADDSGTTLAHADRGRPTQSTGCQREVGVWTLVCGEVVANANGGDGYGRCRSLQMGWGRFARETADDGEFGRIQWGTEPDVGRVAHGVSNRVDRLCGLGNAVVPQIPEIIGRAILQSARAA